MITGTHGYPCQNISTKDEDDVRMKTIPWGKSEILKNMPWPTILDNIPNMYYNDLNRWGMFSLLTRSLIGDLKKWNLSFSFNGNFFQIWPNFYFYNFLAQNLSFLVNLLLSKTEQQSNMPWLYWRIAEIIFSFFWYFQNDTNKRVRFITQWGKGQKYCNKHSLDLGSSQHQMNLHDKMGLHPARAALWVSNRGKTAKQNDDQWVVTLM